MLCSIIHSIKIRSNHYLQWKALISSRQMIGPVAPTVTNRFEAPRMFLTASRFKSTKAETAKFSETKPVISIFFSSNIQTLKNQKSLTHLRTMADYHFVYKDVEGTTTEWDDIQRKLGNLPPKPAPFRPPAFSPSPDESSKPKDKAWIDEKTEEELEDLEDDRDLDDDRFLEEYRKKRLAEIRESVRVSRFGSVVLIGGSDFVREVSQAPEDVWVVVFLYKDGMPECGILSECLDELATKYPATKFVKIISTDCIPNYPDRNLPTLLVYNNGAVKATYVGLHHFGARRCTPEAVALTLCQSVPVLNDGQNGSKSSSKTVIDGVRRRFIEKVVSQHEAEQDEYSSD